MRSSPDTRYVSCPESKFRLHVDPASSAQLEGSMENLQKHFTDYRRTCQSLNDYLLRFVHVEAWRPHLKILTLDYLDYSILI